MNDREGWKTYVRYTLPLQACSVVRDILLPSFSIIHPFLSYIYVCCGLRTETSLRKYLQQADPEQETDDVIVRHTNMIRYFVCRVLQFPAEYRLRVGIANASICHITTESDSFQLNLGLGWV